MLSKPVTLGLALTLVIACKTAGPGDTTPDSRPDSVPVSAVMGGAIVRSGVSGDNWCMTWAADDALLVSMDDGVGWPETPDAQSYFHNNQIVRIDGLPGTASFRARDLPGTPDFSQRSYPRATGIPASDLARYPRHTRAWSWYAYGTVSIRGAFYQFISHTADGGWGWFDGTQLIWRATDGQWRRWNGTDATDNDRWFAGRGGNALLFKEPDRAFSFITIAQFGKDYAQNRDGYVYLYSPNGGRRAHLLNLARVKIEHITERTRWEYFQARGPDGDAIWTHDLAQRGVVHTFPAGWGWYSWSPSVVWSEALGLFIMATGGSQRPGTGDVMDSFMHYETGSLALLWADNPWGPWTRFHWEEIWSGDHPDNRLYMPQLSPKWIEDGGTAMILVYSDARDRHSTNYKWNMQRVRFTLGLRANPMR